MSKARVLGIVIPVAIALVYFYFNPLAPRVYDDAKKETAESPSGVAQNNEQTEASESAPVQVEPLLLESDVENFNTNFESIRNQMMNFKLAETKNPTYEQIRDYLEKSGTLGEVDKVLVANGLNEDRPLLRYFTISNAYGIVSYDKMLQNNPSQSRVIKKMAGENIEFLRKTISGQDTELVEKYFDVLDATFRAHAKKK